MKCKICGEDQILYCNNCHTEFEKNIRQDACIHKWKFDTTITFTKNLKDINGQVKHEETERALYSCEICGEIRKIDINDELRSK